MKKKLLFLVFLVLAYKNMHAESWGNGAALYNFFAIMLIDLYSIFSIILLLILNKKAVSVLVFINWMVYSVFILYTLDFYSKHPEQLTLLLEDFKRGNHLWTVYYGIALAGILFNVFCFIKNRKD